MRVNEDICMTSWWQTDNKTCLSPYSTCVVISLPRFEGNMLFKFKMISGDITHLSCSLSLGYGGDIFVTIYSNQYPKIILKTFLQYLGDKLITKTSYIHTPNNVSLQRFEGKVLSQMTSLRYLDISRITKHAIRTRYCACCRKSPKLIWG